MRTHTFLSVGVSALTLLLLLVSSFYPAVVSAQAIRGSIRGMVTDPSGAGIPAAGVAITNMATNASSTTTSSAEGRFSVLYLPPGEYTITVEVSGFKKLIRQGVNVRIGDELALQLQLELGQVQESVTPELCTDSLCECGCVRSGLAVVVRW